MEKLNEGKIKVEYVSINELKPAEYNPRKLTDAEAKDLTNSIKEFGLVDPIIVNNAKGRENIIIGGHQRYYIAKKLGIKQVPIVYITISDIKKEQELNLRLNKNLGEWDYDLLANFDEELLKNVGFSDKEISNITYDDIDDFFIDEEKLRNQYSVVIKCFSETEKNKVMQILGIKKPSIKAKEFLKLQEDKKNV